MKKFLLIYLAMAGLILSSCEKFLEEDQTGQITSETFYSTSKDAVQALNAVYNPIISLGCFGLNYCVVNELRSDDFVKGAKPWTNATQADVYYIYTFTASEGFISGIWNGYYQAIKNANLVIENVGNIVTPDTSVIRNVIAEAYFFRAYSHFELVRMFGSVPLKDKSPSGLTGAYSGRASVDDIYALIISDLEYACDPKKGLYAKPWVEAAGQHPTQYAAYALLANVYLTLQNWTKAAEYAKKVIDGGKFALWANYKDIFLYSKKFSANTAELGENVFVFNFHQDAGFSSRWGWIMQPPDAYVNCFVGSTKNGRPGANVMEVSQAAINDFEADDSNRKNYVLPSSYTDDDKTRGVNGLITLDPTKYCMKYTNEGQTNVLWGGWGSNIPVIRYSEVLLIYAEAENEANGPANAYAAINQVRGRAGIVAPLSGLNKETFRTAVRKERRTEFLGEAKRIFDLIRWGEFYNTMQSIIPNLKQGQHLLPIPQGELDANPSLKQNEGWN